MFGQMRCLVNWDVWSNGMFGQMGCFAKWDVWRKWDVRPIGMFGQLGCLAEGPEAVGGPGQARHDAAWWCLDGQAASLLVVFSEGPERAGDQQLLPLMARQLSAYAAD